MSTYRVIEGDVRTALTDLEAESVQTCITSPPYWGLRDYGTADWEGGDSECDHTLGPLASSKSRLNGGKGPSKSEKVRTNSVPFRGDVCPKCGAKRVDSQIGLEATPEEYTENMVAVFREVRRVLRDDGTLWLNLGDSYAGARPAGGGTMAGFNDRYFGRETNGDKQRAVDKSKPSRARVASLKDKDLVGIPWRVAFALQADGWYLRSDIIWHKPNPMPESVTDRPTKAHEYLFLLTKSARYYYDADAIREDGVVPAGTLGAKGSEERAAETGVNSRPPEYKVYDGKRNKRTVWTVNTNPFAGAHFAVFPPELIEPCVLAGSAEGDTVLDPFTGSGTTGMVALRHGRDFVGTELNPEYAQMARDRIREDAPLLNEAAT